MNEIANSASFHFHTALYSQVRPPAPRVNSNSYEVHGKNYREKDEYGGGGGGSKKMLQSENLISSPFVCRGLVCDDYFTYFSTHIVQSTTSTTSSEQFAPIIYTGFEAPLTFLSTKQQEQLRRCQTELKMEWSAVSLKLEKMSEEGMHK